MRLIPTLGICIFAAAAIAATCVTRVEQQGTSGPWIGEVVNAGATTVNNTSIRARVLDATGRQLDDTGGGSASICPSTLLPGERGAFQVFYTQQANGYDPVPPLRAEFPPVTFEFPGEGALRGDGLFAEIVARDAAARRIDVRVTNNSDTPYNDLTVCAIMRSATVGHATQVGQTSTPTQEDGGDLLREGESIVIPIFFNEFPDAAGIQIYPRGIPRTPPPLCCMPGPDTGYRVVDARTFTAVLPDGWIYNPLQGIDSYVGEFTGDGATLFFDHGGYSAPPPAADDPAYTITRETIGGFAAHVVVPRTSAGEITGVFFVDDLTYNGSPILFNLTGNNLTPAQQETALQIFRSIRFDPGG